MTNELDHKDLKVDTFCTSKLSRWVMAHDYGVRILHIPTGISVEESSDRSIRRNKAIAIERLTEIVNRERGDIDQVRRTMGFELKYKCRMCGGIMSVTIDPIDGCDTAFKMAREAAAKAYIEYHNCSDRKVGLAELIGVQGVRR